MKLVYQLKDPDTLIPKYIGKGRALRPYEHFSQIKKGSRAVSYRLTSYLRGLLKEGKEPLVEIIADNLSNDEAKKLETNLIIKHGRIDYEENGILLNHRLEQTDWTGKRHTDKSKQKISEANRGRKQQPEHTKKLQQVNTGRKHPPRSEEWKQKQRESHLGRKDSPEALERKHLAHLGEKNPRSKIWKLEREDGTMFEVCALKTWCRNECISFAGVCHTRNTKRFYKGLRLV
jgi:hypothetical protein